MAESAETTWSRERHGRRSAALDVDRFVGVRIRQRRLMLGLTQQQMAELIGVNYQQAHKYETGIGKVSAGRLYQIARALGVSVSYFYEDADTQSHGPYQNPQARSPAAPVKFLGKLKEIWGLESRELAILIGFDDQKNLLELTSGIRELDTRDVKDRVRHLLRMREALHSLFRDMEVERAWLREPHPKLDDRSPLALLLEGSMENFLVVSQFVQQMVGR